MDHKPDTAEPQKPRRRRFQFRLRTLLIGVVLIGSACGYFGHESRIVQERKNWLSVHPFMFIHEDERRFAYCFAAGNENRSPSQLRLWLGDEDCRVLYLFDSVTDALKRAAAMFPEADLLPRSISFKGAIQTLEAFQPLIEFRAAHDKALRMRLYHNLLDAIATHRVADRPDRYEPRLKKRQRSPYERLAKPRAEIKRLMAKGVIKI
jgi:hypothetical protein